MRSLHECIEKFQIQTSLDIDYDMGPPKDHDDAIPAEKKKPTENFFTRAIPLFLGECLFKENRIPSADLIEVKVPEFEPFPLGKSTLEDFNPMAHFQIAPETVDETTEEEFDPYTEPRREESVNSEDRYVTVRTVQNLRETWLSIQPDERDIIGIIKETLILG